MRKMASPGRVDKDLVANVTEAVLQRIGFEDSLGPVAQLGDVDTFFVLASGYLVFFIQCGFCMLCAGSVRAKNAKNIILKNLLDTCFGAVGWYILGYGIAFGADGNDFLGERNFALHDVPPGEYRNWLFQYAFAATATAIVSGAVAERTKSEAYVLCALFLTSWVYPVLAHWIWSHDGWLTAHKELRTALFHGTGLIDFAGSGVVHMTGGLSGLAGAWIAGPRLGRFDPQGKPREIPGHSASLTLLGVFILWFGWYGFNPGSTRALVGFSSTTALCGINTTLSAAAGCISTLSLSMLIGYAITGQVVWDVIGAGNGVLAGLVSITGSCGVVQPWSACITGMIGGLVYVSGSNLMLNVLQIDDPLDSISIHAFNGAWGLFAAAAFADEKLMEMSYSPIFDHNGNPVPRAFGLLRGGNASLLVSAITGIIVILGWVLGHMIPFFFIMKKLKLLRVAPELENRGLDTVHHGGSAYPKDYRLEKLEEQSTEVYTQNGPTNGVKSKAMRDIMIELETVKGQMHRMFQLQRAPTEQQEHRCVESFWSTH